MNIFDIIASFTEIINFNVQRWKTSRKFHLFTGAFSEGSQNYFSMLSWFFCAVFWFYLQKNILYFRLSRIFANAFFIITSRLVDLLHSNERLGEIILICWPLSTNRVLWHPRSWFWCFQKYLFCLGFTFLINLISKWIITSCHNSAHEWEFVDALLICSFLL